MQEDEIMFLCRWSGSIESPWHKLLSSIMALRAATANKQKTAAEYYRNEELYSPPALMALWNFARSSFESFNNNCQVESHCIKLSFFRSTVSSKED